MNSEAQRPTVRPWFYMVFVFYACAVISVTAVSLVREYKRSDGVAFTNGTPVVGDFVCFYAAGRLAEAQAESIYNFELQQATIQRLLYPHRISGWLLYLYPPLLTALFQPLAQLPLVPAYAVWTSLSTLLFLLFIMRLTGALHTGRNARILLVLMAAAYPPFLIDCLVGGQTSVIGLCIIVSVYLAMKDGKDLRAGMVLGLAYYKPPLFIMFFLFLLLRKRWKVLLGAAVSTGFLLSLTVVSSGLRQTLDYFQLLIGAGMQGDLAVGTGTGTLAEFGAGLGSLVKINTIKNPLLGNVLIGLIALSGATSIVHATRDVDASGKRDRRFDLSFALDVAASLFLAPHLFTYDLTVLVVPMILVFVNTFPFRSAPRFRRAMVILFLIYSSHIATYFRLGPYIVLGKPIALGLWIWWLSLFARDMNLRRIPFPESANQR